MGESWDQEYDWKILLKTDKREEPNCLSIDKNENWIYR